MTVYLGSYASANDPGIHVFTLDTTTGALTRTGGVSGVANPSFLAVHPNRRFLYAVGETGNFNGSKGGAVAAFAIDGKTGQLTLLNQESSVGAGPCYVALDHAGKNALVANYGGGSVACLPIGRTGGWARQLPSFSTRAAASTSSARSEPHAHSINVDAQDRFAIAADLGLDKLLVYRFDPARGTLAPNEPPAGTVAPGAGPRHVAFHPTAARFRHQRDQLDPDRVPL
jgi:6-phosphogluconolactonase